MRAYLELGVPRGSRRVAVRSKVHVSVRIEIYTKVLASGFSRARCALTLIYVEITLGPALMHLLFIRVGSLIAGIFTSSRFHPGALLVAFLTWYAHVVHELPLTLV